MITDVEDHKEIVSNDVRSSVLAYADELLQTKNGDFIVRKRRLDVLGFNSEAQ